MSASYGTPRSPWDLTHLLDLSSALSTPSPSQRLPAPQQNGTPRANEVRVLGDDVACLGDFSQVFRFLDTPQNSAKPETTFFNLDYASDGATYRYKPIADSKEVQWTDGTDRDEQSGSASGQPALTKTQRKRRNRQERKAAEETAKKHQATVSESEADATAKEPPARRASTHMVHTPTPPSYALRDNKCKTISTAPKGDTRPQNTKLQASGHATEITDATAAAAVARELALISKEELPSTPSRKTSQQKAKQQLYSNGQADLASVSGPSGMASSPGPLLLNGKPISLQGHPGQPNAMLTALPKAKLVIGPKFARSANERHWAMLTKLRDSFPADGDHLANPALKPNHFDDDKGLHVFIDASNIFIGFVDHLKRLRGIHPLARIANVDISFGDLSLLLERRRPVKKRVIVGSGPNLPAFVTAKDIGYDTNILERVFKARELTERRKYFKELDARKCGNIPPVASRSVTAGIVNGSPSTPLNGNGNGNGSGLGTTTPQYDRAKYVEQGVDEILHMKMLESMVDTDEPSTMVLATGDAAAAEYSPGFKAMLKRALDKGWSVELVSWSKNINHEYTDKEWMDKWGDRFKIIYLDDFAEELLDM